MKILYLLPNAKIYGGTPKKTLDLIKNIDKETFVYFWTNEYKEEHRLFVEAGSTLIKKKHLTLAREMVYLINYIKKKKINVIQTQFSRGELIAGIIKFFISELIIVNAFVNPFCPPRFKKIIVSFFYKKFDFFIYVSKYVKKEKEKQFVFLNKMRTKVIYNGASKYNITKQKSDLKGFSLLDVAALNYWKNASFLIDVVAELKARNFNTIYLYIAGVGAEKENLIKKIKNKNLESHIFLLGNRKDVGNLLENCNIFVHPAYSEGFGIAVAEAMLHAKPIIVAESGALVELIDHNQTGLWAKSNKIEEWVNAIVKLKNNRKLSYKLAANAKIVSEKKFSLKNYVTNYCNLYSELLDRLDE